MALGAMIPQNLLPSSTKPWQEQGVHTLTGAQIPAEAAPLQVFPPVLLPARLKVSQHDRPFRGRLHSALSFLLCQLGSELPALAQSFG